MLRLGLSKKWGKVMAIPPVWRLGGGEQVNKLSSRGLTFSHLVRESDKVGEEGRVKPVTTTTKTKDRRGTTTSPLNGPMNQRISNLIAQLESNSLTPRRDGDPQDIDRLYRPTELTLTPSTYQTLRRKIMKGFNANQIKLYLESLPPWESSHALTNQRGLGQVAKGELVNLVLELWGVEVVKVKKEEEKGSPEKVVEFVTEEEYQSNRREIYFLVNNGGENLRRLELLGNSTIAVNLEEETYVIRGDPSEITKTRQLFQELLCYQTMELDIGPITAQDPHFLHSNGDLLTGIAQVAGTYITAETSPRGQFMKISGLKLENILRTQRLLDAAWKLDHDVTPRAVLYQVPKESFTSKYGLFPCSDPAYLPDFYQSLTLFHLRPQINEYSQPPQLNSKVNDSLSVGHVTPGLSHQFGTNQVELLELPELISKAAAFRNFPVELEAQFGHFLFFDRNTLNQPAFFPPPTAYSPDQVTPLIEKFQNNVQFLPSFPHHKLWEGSVPIEEKTFVKLVFRHDITSSYFWERSPAPEKVNYLASFSAHSIGYSGLEPAIEVVLRVQEDQTYRLESVHFTFNPVVTDVILPACHRSFRLTAQARQPLYNLEKDVIQTLEAGSCPGQLILPTLQHEAGLYRLMSVNRLDATTYSHPFAAGQLNRTPLECITDLHPPVTPSLTRMSLHPSSLDPFTSHPYHPFLRDITELCHY